MKLSKTQLKQIIKEELQAVLSEQEKGSFENPIELDPIQIKYQKTVKAARRDFARARAKLRPFLKKSGGQYASVYKMPKDDSPAGLARKEFSKAYRKLRSLKKSRLAKAMGSSKNLSPEDKLRRQNAIQQRVDKGTSIHSMDILGSKAGAKGAAETADVEANEASLRNLRVSLEKAKKKGDKKQVANIQQLIKKALQTKKDLEKRGEVFGKSGVERVGGGPASAVVSPEAKKEIEAVRRKREQAARSARNASTDNMRKTFEEYVKKFEKEEAALIKKYMKK